MFPNIYVLRIQPCGTLRCVNRWSWPQQYENTSNSWICLRNRPKKKNIFPIDSPNSRFPIGKKWILCNKMPESDMVWSICCSIKFHAPGFSDCAEAAEVAEDETISSKCWEYRHTVRPREWFWDVRQLGKTRFLKHRKQHSAAPNEQCPKERLVCWVRNKMTNHIQKPFWKPLQSRHFDVTSNDGYIQYI